MQALDEAIRAHIADEGQGDFTAAWALVTSGINAADDRDDTVWIECPQHQPRYATIGLLEAGSIMYRGFTYAVMTKHQIDGDGAD